MAQMSESVAPQVIGAEETCAPVKPDKAELAKRRLAVKEHFLRLGTTTRKWALANGYQPRLVYKVINGQIDGNFGKSHEIAVKLGLKDGELTDD
jgi:gp16 family phage-associated protein